MARYGLLYTSRLLHDNEHSCTLRATNEITRGHAGAVVSALAPNPCHHVVSLDKKTLPHIVSLYPGV